MRLLSKKEINRILADGKRLSSEQVTAILDEFERDQPEIYRTIYGEPSDAIAEENPDMAKLYLDLCFDIIWIYRNAFGKPPKIPDRQKLILNSLSLLDTELKSLSPEITMENAFRRIFQKRFVDRTVAAGFQMELLKYLDTEVEKFASFKRERRGAVEGTNSLLFVMVRLMDDIYNQKNIRH